MIKPLSLSQLQQYISDSVKNVFPQGVWITAELVDVRPSGGHLYMELIEKDSRGQTIAKMRANIWRSHYYPLNEKFRAATGSDIVSGLKVMVGGFAVHHPLYGLSFNIRDIDPTYTLGDMERLRREILDRLGKEGIAENNKRLEMPAVPQRIAVISSAGAAGYGDFHDQLLNNNDGFVFYPHLFPAILQGERTSASIREALARIYDTIDQWECVVIIRGGGATTDLNGFDDYELARAVALFPIPVVVGIGHERDRTVLDEIANVRIKTPTGVAAYFVERARDWLTRSQRLVNDISRYATEYLNGEKRRLSQIAGIIPAVSSGRINQARTTLSSIGNMIPALASGRLRQAYTSLSAIITMLPTLGKGKITQAEILLLNIERYIPERTKALIGRQSEHIVRMRQLVEAYSPAGTLARGYSVTRINGKAVKDASSIPPGTEITTELASGVIHSVVRQSD